MSRPLRIEFPGAIYHVTSRGDRREPIYRDDADRHMHLAILAQALERFDAQVLAYCLMGNHYHLVLHTRAANLSRLMRHLNGVYTQAFNRRHGLVGHLLQGRFKAILVDHDTHLLALCRYVERNPVAAGLAARADAWAWSSCRAHLGLAAAPPWLDCDGLQAYVLGRLLRSASDRRRACLLYAALVYDGDAQADKAFWAQGLRQQIYLGADEFAAQIQAIAKPSAKVSKEIPAAQRMNASRDAAQHERQVWSDCLLRCQGDRNAALALAYRCTELKMPALARLAELSVSRISRLVARAERDTVKAGN